MREQKEKGAAEEKFVGSKGVSPLTIKSSHGSAFLVQTLLETLRPRRMQLRAPERETERKKEEETEGKAAVILELLTINTCTNKNGNADSC